MVVNIQGICDYYKIMKFLWNFTSPVPSLEKSWNFVKSMPWQSFPVFTLCLLDNKVDESVNE